MGCFYLQINSQLHMREIDTDALDSADIAAYTAASKTDTLIYQIMGAFRNGHVNLCSAKLRKT